MYFWFIQPQIMSSILSDKKQFSFWNGFLSVFSGGSRIAEFRTRLSRRTNEEALTGDWQAVGHDMWSAFRKLEAEM